MADFAKITEQLTSNKLEDVQQGLLTLQAMLSASNFSQLQANVQTIWTNVSLDILFGCFNYYNGEETGEQIASVAYSVVKRLLDAQDVSIVIDGRFAKYVTLGAKHAAPLARKLVINQIGRFFQASTANVLLLCQTRTDLLSELAQAFRDPELSIVKEAQSAFIAAIRNSSMQEDTVLKMLFSKHPNSFIELAKKATWDKSIYKLRLIEFCVQVAQLSTPAFQHCEASGVFDELISMLGNTANVLDLLNVLEIIKLLAMSPLGTHLLHQRKAFSKIIDILVTPNAQDDAVSSFVLDFIADVSKRGDDAMDMLQPQLVFKQLLQWLNSPDGKSQLVALRVLGSIAANTYIGLNTLLTDQAILSRFVQFGEYNEPHLTMAYLHTLGMILESKVNKESELRTFYLHIENYLQSALHIRLIDRFVYLLKSPFPEQRYAVFRAMRGLARFPWGVQALCAHDKFVDFIIDRSTEMNKDGKEWKFAVAEQMYKTLFPEHNEQPKQNFFDAPTRMKVKKFLHDGPFYVASEPAVQVALDFK